MSRGRGQLIVCSKMTLFTAALALEAAFDGGRLTSDGGLLWLSKMDSTLGLRKAIAAHVPEWRKRKGPHSLRSSSSASFKLLVDMRPRYQDNPRHLHTCHLRHARHRDSSPRRGHFSIRLLTRLRKGASAAPSNVYIFPLFAGLLEVAGPGFEPGHHDFQYSEALRYAENPHR